MTRIHTTLIPLLSALMLAACAQRLPMDLDESIFESTEPERAATWAWPLIGFDQAPLADYDGWLRRGLETRYQLCICLSADHTAQELFEGWQTAKALSDLTARYGASVTTELSMTQAISQVLVRPVEHGGSAW